MDLAIFVYGFSHQQIGGKGEQQWSYTVGLKERFDHPDLLCVQVKPGLQTKFISKVAKAVANRDPLDQDTLDEIDIQLVPVNPCHLRRGLVATWTDRYKRSPVAGDFVQIVPGSSWFCECHPSSIQRLDKSAPLKLRH